MRLCIRGSDFSGLCAELLACGKCSFALCLQQRMLIPGCAKPKLNSSRTAVRARVENERLSTMSVGLSAGAKMRDPAQSYGPHNPLRNEHQLEAGKPTQSVDCCNLA